MLVLSWYRMRMSQHTRRNTLIAVVVAVGAALLLFLALSMDRDSGVNVPEVELTISAVGLDPIVIEPSEYLPDDLGPIAASSPRILEHPDQGDVTLRGDGTVTYAPEEDFEGEDSFAFELIDETGRALLVVRVAVTIEVPDAIGASERTLDFGEVCVWCNASSSIEVTLGDGVRIESIEVADDSMGHFSIAHDCEGDFGEACEVQVTFAPIRPGTSDAVLAVRSADGGDALLVPLRGFGECERPGSDRTAIIEEAVGFGAGATGGAEGCLVRVTSLDDKGRGTLREAAEREGPAWVVFDVPGDIELDRYVYVASDKTIDGRDAEITLEGAGLAIVHTSNIVITNLEIRDTYDDGIQVRGIGAQDVWISHVTIWNVADGYIDITQGATNVTVAWSRFRPSPDWPQEKTILIGAADPGDEDERSRVTLHNNHFEGTEQRSPLLRAGRAHSFNNLFDGWGIYGSGVSRNGQLRSERNIYVHRSGDHPGRAFTPWDEAAHNDGSSAHIRSVEDRFLGGASGIESDPGGVFEPEYDYEAREPNDDLHDLIAERAGRR